MTEHLKIFTPEYGIANNTRLRTFEQVNDNSSPKLINDNSSLKLINDNSSLQLINDYSSLQLI